MTRCPAHGNRIQRNPSRAVNQIGATPQPDCRRTVYDLSGLTALRGNHDQMLLDALAEEQPGKATDRWEWNGGNVEFLPVAREHHAWLEALPLTTIRGPYLFVHAGVRPGVPLEQQNKDDLLWIRHPFLNCPHGLPYTVVHGHSITRDHRIDHRPNRINLDTGAFRTGLLSSCTLRCCE